MAKLAGLAKNIRNVVHISDMHKSSSKIKMKDRDLDHDIGHLKEACKDLDHEFMTLIKIPFMVI